ncbi:MAG: zinc-ribbon domain containing protein [Dehalococcoidia bacterium]
MYADKALRCVACGTDFVFTAREQAFHASKGFTNEPRRCQNCRQARRASGSRPNGADAGAPSNGSAAPSGSDRPRFTTVCSACGGEAVLPFEPVGNRPVLCSTCYDKIRASA